MIGYEILKRAIPGLTETNFRHYLFWKSNMEILDEIIEDLSLSKRKDENEVTAMKRLGRIDWALDQKAGVKMYDQIIKEEHGRLEKRS